jgi:hypothetical protein
LLDISLHEEGDDELQRFVLADERKNHKTQESDTESGLYLLDKERYTNRGDKKGMKQSKALKIFQRATLAIIASNLMLNRKGYMKNQRTLRLKIKCYPENIKREG